MVGCRYRAYIRRASEGEQNNEGNILKVCLCTHVIHVTGTAAGGDGSGVGAAADHSTVAVVAQILTLKKEMAQLLGFKNFAELSLASKMVRR